MKTSKQKIVEIIDRLGISGVKASSMMKIPYSVFRKNMMDNNLSYKFNDKNYSDLADYLISEIRFLILAKKETEVDALQLVNEELDNIFKNYKSLLKQEGWCFIDEINKIIDYMEDPEIFLDMNIYAGIIDTIEVRSQRYKQSFYVHAYTNHVHDDKRGNHDRWYAYLTYRRQQIIKDILSS